MKCSSPPPPSPLSNKEKKELGNVDLGYIQDHLGQKRSNFNDPKVCSTLVYPIAGYHSMYLYNKSELVAVYLVEPECRIALGLSSRLIDANNCNENYIAGDVDLSLGIRCCCAGHRFIDVAMQQYTVTISHLRFQSLCHQDRQQR